MIRAVIFDMDGLILDSERPMADAVKRAVASFGKTLTDTDCRRLIGRPLSACYLLLAEIFGPDFPAREAFAKSHDYYDEIMSTEGVPLKPGVLELLAVLEQRQLPRAVATSTGHARACEQLAGFGILKSFELVVGGDQVARGKPAPDIYREAALGLGEKPGDCWALEDSSVGIQSAHGAGCIAIWIPDLIQPSAELRPLARHVFTSLFEVIDLLDAA